MSEASKEEERLRARVKQVSEDPAEQNEWLIQQVLIERVGIRAAERRERQAMDSRHNAECYVRAITGNKNGPLDLTQKPKVCQCGAAKGTE